MQYEAILLREESQHLLSFIATTRVMYNKSIFLAVARVRQYEEILFQLWYRTSPFGQADTALLIGLSPSHVIII